MTAASHLIGKYLISHAAQKEKHAYGTVHALESVAKMTVALLKYETTELFK
jgi:hypothetical protein